MQVFIIAAMTVDGFIAKDPNVSSTTWTSKEDAVWFANKTKEAGVVVMGNKSYQTIPDKHRPLKDRINIVYSRGQNDKLSKFSRENLAEKNQLLYTDLPAKELVEEVQEAGFKQLAICGGASIYRMFLEAGLVDKLYLTIEPVLFGGGVKLFEEKGSFKDVQNLKLANVHKLSPQTMVMEYDINKFKYK